MNGITSSGAKGINALGQRYMGKYHPLMEIGPRYLLIQGTHRELTEGNGPPFALDVAPMLVLFAIVMTFCILGCFLPSMPLLLICVPIFVPIAKVFGWDLIWFGVIITVLDNMASITPPVKIPRQNAVTAQSGFCYSPTANYSSLSCSTLLSSFS